MRMMARSRLDRGRIPEAPHDVLPLNRKCRSYRRQIRNETVTFIYASCPVKSGHGKITRLVIGARSRPPPLRSLRYCRNRATSFRSDVLLPV